MAIISQERWESLERWSSTAFLVAGILFVADAALVATHVVGGTEPGPLGQAFVGASWTAALVGLLGLYPGLADRSRWLTRIGAVFAVVGTVAYAVMGAVSLAYAAGIPDGELGAVVPVFLPGVLLGTLAFVLFGVAGLRTDVHSWSIDVLLLVLPVLVVVNFSTAASGVRTTTGLLAVVSALALVKLAIGYLLRTEGARAGTEDAGPSSDPIA